MPGSTKTTFAQLNRRIQYVNKRTSMIALTLIDFCIKLAFTQQANVDGARTYQEVGEELQPFAARYPNAAWASWGDYDARQLERDAGFAACPSLLEGFPHFNARKWHAGLYDDRPKSLQQTVDGLGLAGVPITEG